MEEIRLWIRDLGFPIVVASAAIYALYKMFTLRESDIKDFKANVQTFVGAIDRNTNATKELSDTFKDKLGSDKVNLICKAPSSEALDVLLRRFIAQLAEASEKEREKIRIAMLLAKEELEAEKKAAKDELRLAAVELKTNGHGAA